MKRLRLFLLLTVIPVAVYPMGYFKRALAATPSVLYWGLAAGPLVVPAAKYVMLNLYYCMMPPFDPPACAPEVDTFVRNIAEEKGLPKDLQITVGPSWASYAATIERGNRRIYIGQRSDDEWITVDQGHRRVVPRLEKLLSLRAQTTNPVELPALDEELDEIRFVIAHECSHLLHYDLYQHVFFAGALPFVTHNAYKRILAGVLSSTGRAGAAVKITAGLALGMINWVADRTVKRSHEKKADLLVSDPKILRAGARYFKKGQEQQEEMLEKYYPKSTRPYAHALCLKLHEFLDEHPTCNERVTYLEEHAANMERHANQ